MTDDTFAPAPDSPPTDGTTTMPSSTPGAKKKSGGNRWVNVLVGVAVLVFVGGVTFAVGRATAPAQAAAQFPGAGQFPGGNFPVGSFSPGQFPGGGLGNRTITGTVASTDGATMKVTTSTGQTVTVDLSGTTYHSKTPASATDVSQGASVEITVQGASGFPGGPQASPAAGANQTVTASDVTIVGQ